MTVEGLNYLTQGLINRTLDEVASIGKEQSKYRIDRLVYTIERTRETFGNEYDSSKWINNLNEELSNLS